MVEGNPYKVIAKRVRKRFKAEAVGTSLLETVDMKTGEVRTATQLIGKQKLYDSTDFIKFYEPEILIGMGAQAVAVFSYIASHLQFGGFVQVEIQDCLSYTQYTTRQTVYRGIKELLSKDVIRPKGKSEYWVNPNIIYRGQRDELYLLDS